MFCAVKICYLAKGFKKYIISDVNPIKFMQYDLKIFEFFNDFAYHSRAIDILGIFLAKYLPYLLIIVSLSLIFWSKKNQIKNRIVVFLAIASALVARFIVKTAILFFYHRPRPYESLASAHKLTSTSLSDNLQSFPSGHAIFFFALSMGIYFYNKKLGKIFFVSSLAMGLARIFVGLHWPSDIVGGGLLGILTAYLMQIIYSKYKIIIDRFVEKIFSIL